MSRLRKAMMFLMTKSTLLGGIYLGHTLHHDINKLWLNVIEKRTQVKKGYYQNIGELKIFYHKVNGEFIPQYGIEDYRIDISDNLYPKNTLVLNQNSIYELTNLLEQKIDKRINQLNDIEKQTLENKLNNIKNKLTTSVEDSISNLLNTLIVYKESEEHKKEITREYLKDLIYMKIDNH